MARPPNRHSTPPALQGLGKRRSSHKKVRYLNILDDNCELNSIVLIANAKGSVKYGNVPWEASVWNVSITQSQRSHKQRGAYLNFTQHLAGFGTGSRIGEPFDNQNGFSDLVKAIIRIRAEIGGQGVSNQNELILAFRYIYHELSNVDYDLKMLTSEHLEAAKRSVVKRETEISAYKRLEKIEEAARLLDENHLVRSRLSWHCSSKRRPESLTRGRLDATEVEMDNRSKLPQDGIIQAIAHLYYSIPKTEWADRVRICLVSLLIITGFRIGELLTLPARRVQADDDSEARFLAYYPEKGAPPGKKWFMTAAAELATELVDELLELTKASREMAKWLHEHPGEVLIEGLDVNRNVIPIKEVARQIGLVVDAAIFFKSRNVQLIGKGKNANIHRDELFRSLRSETYDEPVNIVKNSGEKLLLKDALACVFCNAFHKKRATLRYAVTAISEQQLADFLSSRAGQPAAFEKYGIEGPDGSVLKVPSHAFRHWLNDLLDRGGLSDIEQAVYFGRRNPRDNRAYQSMTPGERVLQARKDLKSGYMLGPVAKVIARLPVEKQDIVLTARVQAVHVVPGGACFHQFSQSPCPNHMACPDGCGDFHWQTNDAIEVEELKYQESILEVAVQTAKREVDECSWGADNWLQHNIRKLAQVQTSLSQCDPVGKDMGDGDG
jgi:hypothetical protein